MYTPRGTPYVHPSWYTLWYTLRINLSEQGVTLRINLSEQWLTLRRLFLILWEKRRELCAECPLFFVEECENSAQSVPVLWENPL